MSSSLAHKNLMDSFGIIAEFVSSSPADEPAQFVLDLAHRWKERGGIVAGKPRHSDRYLDDLLRALGTPIKSLTPKLVGRTHLRPADAGVLVRLFLSHWDYVGGPKSGEIGGRSANLYEALLPKDEIDEISQYVLERISKGEERSRREAESAIGVSLQNMTDVMVAEFEQAAAVFQVGAGQTLLVARPEMALVSFRSLINAWWNIDRVKDQDRILVWTLDLGRQDFDDPESRVRFINVEMLIARFKALKRFKERVTEARWNWLQSRTVIVLHDTRSVRPDIPRLPAFDPNHVLFSAIPPKWAGSPEFVALYGNERLLETNYTIFLRRSTEVSSEEKASLEERELSGEKSSDLSGRYELRYFGHAFTENGGPEPKSLKLNAPGRSYTEALGTVFVGATELLRRGTMPLQLSIDGMKIDPTYAIEKLRHHGFVLLRLDEFTKDF